MAQEVEPRSKLRLWLALTLLSLAGLAVLAVVVQLRTDDLRKELSEVDDRARSLATDMQVALGLEAAAVRGFLVSGNPVYETSERHARAVRQRAYQRLVPLARRLGPPVSAEVEALGADLAPADAQLERLSRGAISREQYTARFADQQARYQAATTLAARLDHDIAPLSAARNRNINRIQRFGALLTILLALVAMGAALVIWPPFGTEAERRLREDGGVNAWYGSPAKEVKLGSGRDELRHRIRNPCFLAASFRFCHVKCLRKARSAAAVLATPHCAAA